MGFEAMSRRGLRLLRLSRKPHMRDNAMDSDSIPIIDLGPFIGSSSVEQKLAVAAQVKDACSKVGFMYLKNYGIPKEKVMDSITSVSITSRLRIDYVVAEVF